MNSYKKWSAKLNTCKFAQVNTSVFGQVPLTQSYLYYNEWTEIEDLFFVAGAEASAPLP